VGHYDLSFTLTDKAGNGYDITSAYNIVAVPLPQAAWSAAAALCGILVGAFVKRKSLFAET